MNQKENLMVLRGIEARNGLQELCTSLLLAKSILEASSFRFERRNLVIL